MSDGKTTVINSKVYCGGGETDDYGDQHIVYCYDPSQDNWTTLPPLPVRYFCLGQVNGKLVAVGGWKKSNHSTGILSLQSALVVVGGDTSDEEYTDAVEIFKADTSQWYRTDRLSTPCQDISPVLIGNTCYALGGHGDSSRLNQALYASVDDLLRNAVPANRTTHSGSTDTLSAWKTLANTPTYEPAAAVLTGNLLATGGKETSRGRAAKENVYMFSPSTNSWIYISDLPEPRSTTAVAVLSSTKILVIGGWCGRRVSTAYKGTLQLKL